MSEETTRRGMRTQIYLPDDLGERVRAHDGLNVSAVCQQALLDEMTRRDNMTTTDQDALHAYHASHLSTPRLITVCRTALGQGLNKKGKAQLHEALSRLEAACVSLGIM